jgi:hypothetical protein
MIPRPISIAASIPTTPRAALHNLSEIALVMGCQMDAGAKEFDIDVYQQLVDCCRYAKELVAEIVHHDGGSYAE